MNIYMRVPFQCALTSRGLALMQQWKVINGEVSVMINMSFYVSFTKNIFFILRINMMYQVYFKYDTYKYAHKKYLKLIFKYDTVSYIRYIILQIKNSSVILFYHDKVHFSSMPVNLVVAATNFLKSSDCFFVGC